jgi:RNA polymerase sigma-70 factor (ECF subfamily)
MTTQIIAEDAIDTLAKPVFDYLRHYCGDAELAEDLTQDTLMRVATSISNFKGQSTLKTWAFTIATRIACDHFRRVACSISEVRLDDDTDLVDQDYRVEQRFIVDEMNACAREVIDSLPDDYRVALILRDIEGFSVAEVGEICGCSLATAKIRIHRARKRLQESLGRECEFYKDPDDVLRCDRR